MPQQPLDSAQIRKLAHIVVATHGKDAVNFVCDRVIECMGSDPVTEDTWHAVLDMLWEDDAGDSERSSSFVRAGVNVLH